MNETRILLLEPGGDQPSSTDQSLGARLAAAEAPACQGIILEYQRFQRGDLHDLEKSLRSCADEVSGVVGTTGVLESTALGELAEELDLVCFVSNNNSTVWRGRHHVFHIGLPTPSTAREVAEQLLRHLPVQRIFVLYDETEFQRRAAKAAAKALRERGAQIQTRSAHRGGWPDEMRSWEAELVYLVCSDEKLALSLIRATRRAVPKAHVLVGRSLLRHTFLHALGAESHGLLLVDIFERGTMRTAQERLLMKALGEAGVAIATTNHGFGWDAMSLCALALEKGGGEPAAAIAILESGFPWNGVTGEYRFASEDHNGRSGLNPTKLSRMWHGRLEPLRRATPKVSDV